MNCGSPRIMIHETALQLLQILDNRFFGTILPLGNDDDFSCGKERSTLDVLLSTTYSRWLSDNVPQLSWRDCPKLCVVNTSVSCLYPEGCLCGRQGAAM